MEKIHCSPSGTQRDCKHGKSDRPQSVAANAPVSSESLRRLPLFVRELLDSCPIASEGVHKWIFRIVHHVLAHFDERTTFQLIKAESAGCGRPLEKLELEIATYIRSVFPGRWQSTYPQGFASYRAKTIRSTGGGAMNLDGLREFSIEQWEALCRYLLPGGHKEGCRWLAGSNLGEPGRSFDVNLRTGIFGDWASEDKKQRGPINFWMAVMGVDFKTAAGQLTAWLGRRLDIPGATPQETAINERRQEIFFPPGLCKPTEGDLQILSRSRTIGMEALQIAVARGFIFCFNDVLNGRCWLYTDQRRGCGLRRRLDGKPFRLSDGSQHKVACCPGSSMRIPIGYQEAESFPCLGIVEGAPDALALLAHAWASGVERQIAPICMPYAGADFTDSSLAYLQNKRARIFVHDDATGQKAANRWATQLQSVNVAVDAFIFTGLFTTDGRPVKDLNDLLKVDCDSWEQFRNQVEAVTNFAL